MLAAIVVLPQPPLLVPELAGAAVQETEPLRRACRDVLAGLAGVAHEWVVVGADAGGRRTVPPGTRGTFAGYGRDVRVTLPAAPDATGSRNGASANGASPDADLPLPLLVAAWVAGAVEAAPVRMRGELVAPDADPQECATLGAELAGAAQALVVVGDGSARRSPTAPGGFDERAEAFDAAVADALDTADPEALAALDPSLAGQLWAGGRAPWQVLAGAARAGGPWSPGLRHSSAPYGVAYHVASWRRAP